jgi:hypothetical protein
MIKKRMTSPAQTVTATSFPYYTTHESIDPDRPRARLQNPLLTRVQIRFIKKKHSPLPPLDLEAGLSLAVRKLLRNYAPAAAYHTSNRSIQKNSDLKLLVVQLMHTVFDKEAKRRFTYCTAAEQRTIFKFQI